VAFAGGIETQMKSGHDAFGKDAKAFEAEVMARYKVSRLEDLPVNIDGLRLEAAEADAGQQQPAPCRPLQRFGKTMIGRLPFRFRCTQQGSHAAIIRQKRGHLRPDPGQKHIPIACGSKQLQEPL
jgi:hypothetical protein